MLISKSESITTLRSETKLIPVLLLLGFHFHITELCPENFAFEMDGGEFQVLGEFHETVLHLMRGSIQSHAIKWHFILYIIHFRLKRPIH